MSKNNALSQNHHEAGKSKTAKAVAASLGLPIIAPGLDESPALTAAMKHASALAAIAHACAMGTQDRFYEGPFMAMVAMPLPHNKKFEPDNAAVIIYDTAEKDDYCEIGCQRLGEWKKEAKDFPPVIQRLIATVAQVVEATI